MARKTFLISFMALALAACPRQEPSVELRGHRFSVEVADTDDTRQKGLMFRTDLPADHGMLFVFPSQAPRAFWMKNTRIPLDILYFDRHFKLVAQQRNVPPCRTAQCPSYPSGRAAKYVLELNAGTAEKLELRLGDELKVFHIDTRGKR